MARITIIDDSDDIVHDQSVRDAHVRLKDVGISLSHVVFATKRAFPDVLRGLDQRTLQQYGVVASVGDDTVSGGVSKVENNQIRVNKRA